MTITEKRETISRCNRIVHDITKLAMIGFHGPETERAINLVRCVQLRVQKAPTLGKGIKR